MKRFLLLIIMVILMPLTFLAVGANESNESVEAELKLLKSQVAPLEKRVQTLETQLADKTLEDFQPAIPQRPQISKGWHKRQFNGIPYYVIPLQQNSNK